MPPKEGNPFTLRTPERHSGRQGTANQLEWQGSIHAANHRIRLHGVIWTEPHIRRLAGYRITQRPESSVRDQPNVRYRSLRSSTASQSALPGPTPSSMIRNAPNR